MPNDGLAWPIMAVYLQAPATYWGYEGIGVRGYWGYEGIGGTRVLKGVLGVRVKPPLLEGRGKGTHSGPAPARTYRGI